MYEFNSAIKDFNQDIFPDNSNATIGSIITDNNFKGRPVYTHFHNYYTIWKSGISIGIVDYRFGYLRRTDKSVYFPTFEEWKDKNYIYKGEYSKLDYLLVRNSIQTNLKGFEKEMQNVQRTLNAQA